MYHEIQVKQIAAIFLRFFITTDLLHVILPNKGDIFGPKEANIGPKMEMIFAEIDGLRVSPLLGDCTPAQHD